MKQGVPTGAYQAGGEATMDLRNQGHMISAIKSRDHYMIVM